MKNEIYLKTLKDIGFIPLKKSNSNVYKKLGFKCGLEVHQQLKTKKKLFCRCPAGEYFDFDNYDAEIVRHMRPTLSELGDYDRTALMEFKTKKNITYKLNNKNSCTYEVDDTPPFPINKEALHHAILVSHMLKLNIVGELHITRKQYLDGSIPTGFQRTAIIGIEGEIPISNKKIRIAQLSIEEDSCREIKDVGHERHYFTDRLGIPLIETVTYPDMKTPQEAFETAQYIRFMNRSSEKVRTGIGSGREDVNVSIKGGTRVEIKGVSHNKWIPKLVHNEAFRQKSLLNIKKILDKRTSADNWKLQWDFLKITDFNYTETDFKPFKRNVKDKNHLIIINLPYFKNILSHFNQPELTFAEELSGRLKVIACLEKPNMIHNEQKNNILSLDKWEIIQKKLNANPDDAQILIWVNDFDLKTAIETIEERCLLAFQEIPIPPETRKSLSNGNTIFERVLPGADRMYPDTDSAPISIDQNYIDDIRKEIPKPINERIKQLTDWNIPKDCFTYILKNNLMPLINKTISDFKLDPVFVTTLFAHKIKNIEGKSRKKSDFKFSLIYKLLEFLLKNHIEIELSHKILPVLYKNPKILFDATLDEINFNRINKETLTSDLKNSIKIFEKIKTSKRENALENWIMGNIREKAIGNIKLSKLNKIVKKYIKEVYNGNF